MPSDKPSCAEASVCRPCPARHSPPQTAVGGRSPRQVRTLRGLRGGRPGPRHQVRIDDRGGPATGPLTVKARFQREGPHARRHPPHRWSRLGCSRHLTAPCRSVHPVLPLLVSDVSRVGGSASVCHRIGRTSPTQLSSARDAAPPGQRHRPLPAQRSSRRVSISAISASWVDLMPSARARASGNSPSSISVSAISTAPV